MDRPVLLAAVARSAGGHHVLPHVRTAPTAGDHVVDVFRRRPAVLTAVVVAGEDGPAVEGGPGPVWHLHEMGQADHRGGGHHRALGVQRTVAGVEDLGLLLQDQYHRPPHRDDTQGLVRRVEDERLRHVRPGCGRGRERPLLVAGASASRVADPVRESAWETPTPGEVRHHIGRRRPLGPVAERGLKSEPQIDGVGNRKGWPSPPPAGSGQAQALVHRHPPQPGADGHSHRRRPEPPSSTQLVTV